MIPAQPRATHDSLQCAVAALDVACCLQPTKFYSRRTVKFAFVHDPWRKAGPLVENSGWQWYTVGFQTFNQGIVSSTQFPVSVQKNQDQHFDLFRLCQLILYSGCLFRCGFMGPLVSFHAGQVLIWPLTRLCWRPCRG